MAKPRAFFARDVAYHPGGWYLGWRADHIAGKELLRRCATPDGACLEIGADKGRLQEEIESRGCRWIGLDIRFNPALSLVADGHVLPFRSDIFDSVLLVCVVEHLARPRQALLDIYRVLKPGAMVAGVVGFVEPFHDSYCHFSHWGIERLLRDSGFSHVVIQPGWNGLAVLAGFLLTHGRPTTPALRPALVFLQTAIRLALLVRWWGRRLIGVVPGKGAVRRRNRIAELEREDSLMWAGHIWFSAVKYGVPRVRLVFEED
jgi:SAM-dependent methyltransferase